MDGYQIKLDSLVVDPIPLLEYIQDRLRVGRELRCSPGSTHAYPYNSVPDSWINGGWIYDARTGRTIESVPRSDSDMRTRRAQELNAEFWDEFERTGEAPTWAQ